MPVPQEINFIVEQASCLFLTMMQDVSKKKSNSQHRNSLLYQLSLPPRSELISVKVSTGSDFNPP